MTDRAEADLTDVFGDKPQVRLVQASLMLSPYKFNRNELAKQAGLWEASSNRVVTRLEKLHLIKRASKKGEPVLYEVNKEGSLFQLLAAFEPAAKVAMWRDAARAERVAPLVVEAALQTTLASNAVPLPTERFVTFELPEAREVAGVAA